MSSIWAPGHAGGESGTPVGKRFERSGKRSQMVLATKVGKPMGPDKKGLSPAYIRSAVEDSLRRLRTDHIDLHQTHDGDADTPLANTLGAFDELVRAGKVRSITASNCSAPRLAQALRLSTEHRQGRAAASPPPRGFKQSGKATFA